MPRPHGDARRTLIQEERRAVAEVRIVDEPVTVVVSLKGWVRALKGHEVDAAALSFKAGDALYGDLRLPQRRHAAGLRQPTAASIGVPLAALPGGRGDGQPVTSLIDLEPGTQTGALLRRARLRRRCCWPTAAASACSPRPATCRRATAAARASSRSRRATSCCRRWPSVPRMRRSPACR